ncbi:transcription termination factor Rho [Cutibacterium acnes JCM 18909]|nr:transcription termination factor Rho [Cutibacterium acnes JCM 18909]GAE74799.1 transcription termination factor Rho [Cutibacterium acnes JCM 18918]
MKKFAPLVKIEQVNGVDPEQMKQRPEFSKLTPLYPQERLRLEDDPKKHDWADHRSRQSDW